MIQVLSNPTTSASRQHPIGKSLRDAIVWLGLYITVFVGTVNGSFILGVLSVAWMTWLLGRNPHPPRGALWATAIAAGLMSAMGWGVVHLSVWWFLGVLLTQTLPFAIVGWWAGRCTARLGWLGLWSIPVFWCCAELMMGATQLWHAFTNPALRLGYLVSDPQWLKFAAFGGTTLLSLLVSGLGVAIGVCLLERKSVWLLMTLACSGLFWMVSLEYNRNPGRTVRVGLAQPGITDKEFVAAANNPESLEARHLEKRYSNLIRTASAANVQVLMMPENALPWFSFQSQSATRVLRLLEPMPEAILGARISNDTNRAWNGVLHWVKRRNSLRAVYAKRQLLPFAEDQFEPGQVSSTHDVAGVRVGFGVCWESAFADQARQAVRSGARWLIYPSNTAFARGTASSKLQARFVQHRAASLGRPSFYITMSGSSAAFDANGTPVATARDEGAQVVIVDQSLTTHDTFYSSVGDWLAAPLSLLAAGLVIVTSKGVTV